MASRTRRLLRAAAESDTTFELVASRGREYLVGKCIHCATRVTVPLDPDEPAHATLEHIVPKNHGGDDAPENLCVACRRCNHAKGRQLDRRRADDATLARVIDTLQVRRRERLRLSAKNPVEEGRRGRPDRAAGADRAASSRRSRSGGS
ncbi:MAG TPA: HNH endonuclease [Polyangiales bacterium]|nr:HNH endonuclease [Polyangiales bacterium]